MSRSPSGSIASGAGSSGGGERERTLGSGVAGGGGLHEWAGAVVQVGHQADRRVRAQDVRVVDDLVDDPAEVGVVAGDDAHDEVADAGDGVDLEHLGDRGQVRHDGGMTLPLPDLERAERCHGIAPVSYTHLRAHETVLDIVCRLLLEKKK